MQNPMRNMLKSVLFPAGVVLLLAFAVQAAPPIGERLAAMGCTHAQGYFYGRPMPLHDVASWAARHAAQA